MRLRLRELPSHWTYIHDKRSNVEERTETFSASADASFASLRRIVARRSPVWHVCRRRTCRTRTRSCARCGRAKVSISLPSKLGQVSAMQPRHLRFAVFRRVGQGRPSGRVKGQLATLGEKGRALPSARHGGTGNHLAYSHCWTAKLNFKLSSVHVRNLAWGPKPGSLSSWQFWERFTPPQRM